MPEASRYRELSENLITLLGVVALLDLTTGAFSSFIDVFGPIPETPLWTRAIEGLVLLAALPGLLRRGRRIGASLRELPGARWGRGLMAVYLLGTLGVMLFRTEAYPFSSVGMFSAVPDVVDISTPRRVPSLVMVADGRVMPVAALREGSALPSTLETGWDYKAGWVMLMFGTSDSHALGHATEVARQNGFERAERALVVYDPRSGLILAVEPYRRIGGGP